MNTDTAFSPFIGICRHRLHTDGQGVTTLAAFHGCPLHCRYCLNPQCKTSSGKWLWHSPESLYEEVRQDELYFLATEGGITFGGGEPLLQTKFIHQFREICGTQWRITVETSLHVPSSYIETIVEDIDEYIIDIKDMNPVVYQNYTQCDNKLTLDNLSLLHAYGKAKDCLIRTPLIAGFNSVDHIISSQRQLRHMGFPYVSISLSPIHHSEKLLFTLLVS